MQSLINHNNLDNTNDLILERPIGWSSACLDSTIDYYLDCNYSDLSDSKEEKQSVQEN
jgi:hypothetical protein